MTTVLTQTRVVRDTDGPTRIGGVNARRKFIWRGPAGDPVFEFRDSRDGSVERVDVVCESPTEAVFLSHRTKRGPSVIPSTGHQFRDVRVYGNGLAERGFYACDTIDENNEHMRFDAVSMFGCRFAWVFAGQQSKEHLLTLCRASQCERGIVAGSSFTMLGGAINVCQVGITLTRVGDPVAVIGVGFEACVRMLETPPASTDSQPIVFIADRYAADQLHADGACVLMRNAGPLTSIGGTFGDGEQRVPRVHLAGIGEQVVNLIGQKFGSFGANTLNPVTWNPGIRGDVIFMGPTFMLEQSAAERTSTTNVAIP